MSLVLAVPACNALVIPLLYGGVFQSMAWNISVGTTSQIL